MDVYSYTYPRRKLFQANFLVSSTAMTRTFQFGWTHHPAASNYVTVLHHIQFFLACMLDESSLSIQYVYCAAFLLWSVFAFAIMIFGERNPFVSDAFHFQFLSSRKSWASSIRREWYGMNACSWVAVSTLNVCIILYLVLPRLKQNLLQKKEINYFYYEQHRTSFSNHSANSQSIQYMHFLQYV